MPLVQNPRCRPTATKTCTPHELETSILLQVAPDLLRPGYDTADWRADDRPFLLVSGMQEYTESGVIGFPSLGTAQKGARALASLSDSFKGHLQRLTA